MHGFSGMGQVAAQFPLLSVTLFASFLVEHQAVWPPDQAHSLYVTPSWTNGKTQGLEGSSPDTVTHSSPMLLLRPNPEFTTERKRNDASNIVFS